MEVWGRPPGHGGGQGPTGKKWIYVSKLITLKKNLCVKTRYTNFGQSKGYAFGKFSLRYQNPMRTKEKTCSYVEPF